MSSSVVCPVLGPCGWTHVRRRARRGGRRTLLCLSPVRSCPITRKNPAVVTTPWWGLTRAHESGMIDTVRDKTAKPTASWMRTVPRQNAVDATKRASHDVAIVVYDGFTPFELGVACEVFGDDRWVAPGDPWYRLFICGDTSAPVTADGGFQILVPHGLETLSSVDTVIVSPTYRPEEIPESVFEALRRAHARGCRILSHVRRGLRPGRGRTTRRAASGHPLDGVRRAGPALSPLVGRPWGALRR